MFLDFLRNSDLPSFHTLFSEINTDMGNSQIWLVLVLACLMLTLHGVAVLMIAGTFHWIDQKLENKRVYGANFVSYFIAILLIIAVHFVEIIAWAYICVALKVFPTNPQTFYFAGEMYTTVGYGDYTLSEHWRVLPIIISFSGIFAVSMSGAALYSMMGALLGRTNQNPRSGTGF
ncbi:ion channel [Polynucleobacter sp. AP-Kolm-20A-A1]|uniref:ion channel n=1 Tax=Polynucleobacter sp. AP-Kolm-20A-A1 TaxID=2081041 RepID=UPI001BFDC092|nr:ion channel [Polynucleobacter sp. AP-Kolm-20A-A1]QWE21526.1 transporter [Polynucleobacter sp. AP-Kolm-20A-A1]